jgi:hypothetical protein
MNQFCAAPTTRPIRLGWPAVCRIIEYGVRRRLHPSARQALEVFLANRLHLGGRRSNATEL